MSVTRHSQRQVNPLPAEMDSKDLAQYHETFSKRRHAFTQHREAVAKKHEESTTQRIPRRSSLQKD